jgi:hypothetical protein
MLHSYFFTIKGVQIIYSASFYSYIAPRCCASSLGLGSWMAGSSPSYEEEAYEERC